MNQEHSMRLPNYVSDKTPEGLRRRMLAVQIRENASLRWTILNVSGKWFAWYPGEVTFGDQLVPNEAPKET